ncbi:hypothetical protein [Sagittula marina]|uniref:hypothetical protein n=1 Tax=Sagittula marina TaxID=943940 RepID=UPI0031E134BB
MEFDLLGDPIPEGRGKAGRTGHVPTSENASKIRTLLVAGMTNAQIAQQLGITVPTLRKHYFHSGRVKPKLAREMAVSESKAKLMLQLQGQADKGSVSAMKALYAIFDKAELAILEEKLGQEQPKEKSQGVKRHRELIGRDADDALEAELSREVHGLH